MGGAADLLPALLLLDPPSSLPFSTAFVSEHPVFCTGELADSSICWFPPVGQPGLLSQFVL